MLHKIYIRNNNKIKEIDERRVCPWHLILAGAVLLTFEGCVLTWHRSARKTNQHGDHLGNGAIHHYLCNTVD